MRRHNWELAELHRLYATPLLELIQKASAVHRSYNRIGEVQRCELVNIKEGGCPEDCSYCSQSAHYETDVMATPLMSIEEVVERARKAKEQGVTRVCLGAAWRGVRQSAQFDRVLEMIRQVCTMGVEVCVTLGLLGPAEAKKLREAGLYAYNHNLDTSERHYKKIITTRTFSDRLRTHEAVREAGISLCSGGILGLGEEPEDHLLMLQVLANKDPHPESLPINRRVDVKGVPLEGEPLSSVWELIRLVAVARIVFPTTMIRLSAGRLSMTIAEQGLAFLAGANSIFIGDQLLTTPNPDYVADEELFSTLGLFGKRPTPLSTLSDKLPTHFEGVLSCRLKEQEKRGWLRTLSPPAEGLIDFSSSDYLGMARNPSLREEILERVATLDRLGATSARLLTGNTPLAERVEQQIATHHQAEAALLLTSGYVANLALLSCCLTQEDTLLVDEGVHASIWDGARLSRARVRSFRHNDLEGFTALLQRERSMGRSLFVMVEGLYSMSGQIAPLQEMTTLCRENGATLFVDEAHATGVIGEHGEGVVVDQECLDGVAARVVTFGKALGLQGAALLGSQELIRSLINGARPFIYTTAMAPLLLEAISATYEWVGRAEQHRRRLASLRAHWKELVDASAFTFPVAPGPIQFLPTTGGPGATRALAESLQGAGFDLRPILPPTVREGKEGLRLTFHSYNTRQELSELIDLLSVQDLRSWVAA